MSSYGSTVVLDSPDEAMLLGAARSLAEGDASVYRSVLPDGATRLVVATPAIEQVERVSNLLSSLRTGRAAVAEDNDEFGAAWTVLAVEDGTVRTVHRRYVLNADPADPADVTAALQDLGGTDPRTTDVAGEQAAANAAALFGVAPGPVIDAEKGSDQAWMELGTVGGPFPWWSALQLPWPGPDAGELIDPHADTSPRAAEKDRVFRLGSKGFTRWLADTLIPRLGEDAEWAVGRTGIYQVPVEWFLKGLVATGSSSGFYVFAYTCPLVSIVPAYIFLNYSQRVFGPETSTFPLPSKATADEIADQVAEAWRTQRGDAFVERQATPQGFLEYVDKYRRDAPDQGPELYAGHGIPAGACQLLLGNDDAARREFSYLPAEPSSDHSQQDIDLARELLHRLSRSSAEATNHLASVRDAALAAQLSGL